jgi:SSS family solute:Na+ symporter
VFLGVGRWELGVDGVPSAPVNIYLVLLIVYSVGVVALGVWTSRFIRQSSDFFVGGRSLGPGLIFATMLAANIGAGSTVGAAGQAYKDGIGAWWWVGSAGIGSLVFAFTVAPALWKLAKTHNFYTTGDYLEFRYDGRVRAAAAIIVCLGALTILAAQLIAGAAILNVILGIPRWAGALIGAGIMTIYFVAGGLLGSAWVNTLQLGVMLAGFLTALPFVYIGVGGIGGVLNADAAPAWFGDFFYSTGPNSGWMFLLLTGPSFIVSPGLIQKAYGAKSERALRLGIGLNAVVLMLFACLPVFFGMTARAVIPDYINDPNTVLPTFLMTQLPAWLGALALAAVFSTEVDTCDAILFMLSTSVSKDIYKRHVNPGASDAQLLRVARLAAVAGGAAGVVLSVVLATVITALTIFYSVIIVSLFVPIVGGLYIRRANANAALTSMAAGVITLFIVRFSIASSHWWRDPLVLGLGAAMVAFAIVLVLQRFAPERREI